MRGLGESAFLVAGLLHCFVIGAYYGVLENDTQQFHVVPVVYDRHADADEITQGLHGFVQTDLGFENEVRHRRQLAGEGVALAGLARLDRIQKCYLPCKLTVLADDQKLAFILP